MVQAIEAEPLLRLDYAAVVDAGTLEPVDRVHGATLLAVAADAGTTRLIDNVTLSEPRRRDHRRSRSAHQRRPRPGALMYRTMMKSKIHRATITGADLNYVGSITLDPRLLELADLMEHEQVHVLDIDNGARFETYVIPGGPGDVIVNGAAARLVQAGDRVILISYAQYDEAELEGYEPLVVHVDDHNRPTVHSVARGRPRRGPRCPDRRRRP